MFHSGTGTTFSLCQRYIAHEKLVMIRNKASITAAKNIPKWSTKIINMIKYSVVMQVPKIARNFAWLATLSVIIVEPQATFIRFPNNKI